MVVFEKVEVVLNQCQIGTLPTIGLMLQLLAHFAQKIKVFLAVRLSKYFVLFARCVTHWRLTN
jgi:hypothetical protein